jgi:tetratricopeptide (TPR) repeat protein
VEKAKGSESEYAKRTTKAELTEEKAERFLPESVQKEQVVDIDDLLTRLIQAEGNSDWSEVIKLGERILKLNRHHQPTRSKTAAAYKSRGVGRVTGYSAISDLSRAIELERQNPDFYHARGVSYMLSVFKDKKPEDFDRAIRDFDRAIELDPKHSHSHFSRGYLNMTTVLAQLSSSGFDDLDKTLLDQALADLDRAIELNPKQAWAHFWRGRGHHIRFEWNKALADYNRAIELDSEVAEFYYWRGKLYKDTWKLGQVLTKLRLKPPRGRFRAHGLRDTRMSGKLAMKGASDDRHQ